jgi:uncharacterized protein DUF2846
MLLWRAAVLSALTILFSGCATVRSGADFASLSQRIDPPKPGQARVVVFREQAFGGLFDEGWDVKLDGEQLRELKTGTYVYADSTAGRHRLTSSMALFPGVTQLDFTVSQGRSYFFLARLSERARTLNTASAAGGIAGLVVVSAITSGDNNPGPLDFIPLEETAAREAIAALRLAD